MIYGSRMADVIVRHLLFSVSVDWELTNFWNKGTMKHGQVTYVVFLIQQI